MNMFARFIDEGAKAHINALTKKSSPTPHELGEVMGWQRIRDLLRLSPLSIDIITFDSRLTWAEAVIHQNDPTEFELGIAYSYRFAMGRMVDDYRRTIKERR